MRNWFLGKVPHNSHYFTEVKMKYVIHDEELEWGSHPDVQGGKMVTFFTKKEQGAQATIGMVKIPKGAALKWHDHGDSDDILYILDGKAKMEMEGIGNMEMRKGSHVLVPSRVKHRIHDVSEDLTLYHIKAPATI